MTNEQLVILIKSGVDVSNNMLLLWQQTKGFIHTIAVRYQGQVDIEDLEQEGYLALYDAVDGFCPDQGYKFLTYAKHWIMQRIRRYIDNCCHAVKIPSHRQQVLQEYRKMVNAFQVYLGRMPTRAEIVRNLHLNSQQLDDLEATVRMAQIGSLDSYVSDDEDSATVGDMVPCDMDVEGSVLDGMESQQLKDVLWGMVDSLPDDQSQVIRLRYQAGQTTRAAGEHMGISAEEARRIESKALAELRRPHRAYRLRPFLPDALGSLAYHGSVGAFNRTWTSSTERIAMRL